MTRKKIGFPEAVGKAVGAWGAFWLLGACFGMFEAWVLMLAVGDLHHQWYRIPAWSYWTFYALVLAVQCLWNLTGKAKS